VASFKSQLTVCQPKPKSVWDTVFSRDGADIGQVDANAFQEGNGWIGFEHELINPLR